MTDIFVLSLIFFGEPTISAIDGYLDLLRAGVTAAPVDMGLNSAGSTSVMVLELCTLVVAWLYLRWRQFDFGVLNFSVNRYTVPLALLLIVCAGIVADAYQYLHWSIWPHHYPDDAEIAAATDPQPAISFSALWIGVSVLNGFYEEIFFMGLVYAVRKDILPHAIVWSLGVRYIFHIYQGLAGAATVATLGIVFLVFRRRIPVLVPFMLAHAFFDVFGLGLLSHFWD